MTETDMGILEKIGKLAGKKDFVSAVILAAGSGERFSGTEEKQFAVIAGTPVIVRSCTAFQDSPLIDEIVVVAKGSETDGIRNMLQKSGITKLTRVTPGGDTRQQSAKKGFDAVNPDADYVMIHDAARCLVTGKIIKDVLDSAKLDGAASAATKATDTIKTADIFDMVDGGVDRHKAWIVQTPQAFRADMYRAAAYLAVKNGFEGTDDTSLVQEIGFKVKMVECGKKNIKITYPEDAVIAEALIRNGCLEG